MATLPPPAVKNYPEESIEKKVYGIIDSLDKYLPLMNDRNRLSFALLNYLKGQGDPPAITVRNNKLTIENISQSDLVKLIEDKLKDVQK